MRKLFQISAYVVFSLGNFQYAMAGEIRATPECGDLEHNAYLENADLTILDRTDFPIDINSTEGTELEIYKNQDRIFVIKAAIFGEMGQIRISYYSTPANTMDYFVVVASDTYTAPITHETSTVGWISTHRFMVCDGDKNDVINMISSEGASTAYSLAVKILDVIQEKIQP